jgi:hypothetical protein
MPTEEQAASAYEQATDGCRPSVLGTRDDARQWSRVKPDEELHPLAELDYEKEPTWKEPLVTTRLPHLCSERTYCTTLVIEPPALYEQPTEKDCVAAV